MVATSAPAHAQRARCVVRGSPRLWIECPKAAPADADPCPAVHKGIHMGGRRPKEWNDVCVQAPPMECFLRRLAESNGGTFVHLTGSH